MPCQSPEGCFLLLYGTFAWCLRKRKGSPCYEQRGGKQEDEREKLKETPVGVAAALLFQALH